MICMKMRSVAPMKIAKIGYLVMSVIFCVIGAFLIWMPEPSLCVFGCILGIAMIAFGVVKMIGYFSKDLYRLAFQFDLQFGILMIVLGTIVLIRPEKLIDMTLVALGIAIVADALFRLRVAIDAKRFGIGAWWLIAVFAFLTFAVGVIVAFRPWESVQILLGFLGAALIAQGLLNLVVAIFTVKIINNQYPDAIDGRMQ
jgi:uncharacterized membrane protein HdeD (DUF308 family)